MKINTLILVTSLSIITILGCGNNDNSDSSEAGIVTSKIINEENNYYRGLGVINMVKSINGNNISQDEILLPFRVLEVMCALETYDGNGRWEKIKQQFYNNN